MKLFTETKTSATEEKPKPLKKNSGQHIVIISPRKSVLQELSSHLKMHNMKNIYEQQDSFFDLKDESMLNEASAVIIDIGTETDIEFIIETATLILPTFTRQVFVGDNDSIAFAQSLLSKGLIYLNLSSQLIQLATCVQGQSTPSSPLASRSMLKFSVIGCKGGVGASSVALQLFQTAGELTSIPSLLVQGASGSNDLDLLMEQAIPKDGSIYPINNTQSICVEIFDSAWSYNDPNYNKFNLIFFDHGLYSALTLERLEMIISQSHTLLLVITRELSAVRAAKKILDENVRVHLANPEQAIRIVICLNENHPKKSDELRDEDIAEYLERKIDAVSSYRPDNKKISSADSLYQLAANLVGKNVAEPTGKKSLSFSNLFRRKL